MMDKAKFWVALVGAIASALLTVFAQDTTVGQVLNVIVVVATAIGVYAMRNAGTGGSGSAG